MKASVACHVAAAGLIAMGSSERPQSWRLGAAALALDHLALSGAGCFPHRPWLGPVITDLPAAGRLLAPRLDIESALSPGSYPETLPNIALTFDDGPDPDVTPRIAQELEARGLRATFFIIGERASRHPEIVQALHEAGHRLENHTDSHSSSFAFSFLPYLDREIGACQAKIAQLTGRPPTYFRAPAGMRNPLLECALARQGLHLVSWTRRAYDTADGDPERVLARLTGGLGRGDILLLHDGNVACTPSGRAVSLEILPRLLDHLEAVGLQAGPLPIAEDFSGEMTYAAR